jgi:uncharacterized membrane protein
MLQTTLGADGLKIAAALLAKNIGGGINYVAVCSSLAASPQSIAAGLCVDNIFALLYFPATNALGSGQPDVVVDDEDDDSDHSDKTSLSTSSNNVISVQSASIALSLSTALLWLGERIGGTAGQLPICTLLTVLFASIVPRIQNRKQQSNLFTTSFRETCNIMGTLCLYLFFSTAGSPGIQVADTVKSSLWPLTVFLSSLYVIHGLLLWLCYGIGRRWGTGEGRFATLLRSAFCSQRLLTASSSAIGGPATSVALAQTNKWKSLMVPALLVGNIGYAIATFCGLAFYYMLK